MKTARDDASAAHDDRTDRGIRTGLAEAAPRFEQGCAHELVIKRGRSLG